MATKTIEELKKELRNATQNRKKVRLSVELSDRFYLSDAIVALHYAKEAWKYSKALPEDADKALALSKYARCLSKTSEHVKAREFLHEALRMYREADASKEIPIAMNLLANTYLPTGEYAKALTIYSEALDLASSANDDMTRELILGNMGLVYRNIGDYYRSFKYQSQAFELATTLGAIDLTPGYLNLAIVYWELNEHDKARDYLEKALELATAANDVIGIQKSLINLAEIDETDGNLDEALEKCDKALIIARDHDFRNEEARIIQRSATIYGRKKEYKNALLYFDKAIDLSVNYDLDTNIPSLFGAKAQVQVAQNNMDEAEPLLAEGIKVAKLQNARQDESEMQLLLSDCLAARGEYQLALEHYKRYSDLRNELFAEDQRQAMVQAHIRLEVESSLREAEQQRRERERLEFELASKQQELTAVALQIAKQNETLGKLTEQLRTLPSGGTEEKRKATSILREIDRLRGNDSDWKLFETQFDTIHAGFMAKLLEKHPSLTPKEVRVCALMKLNLSSKDIANTLAISQRTVEVHRLQIRKKMKLRQNDSLANKLVSIQ